MLKKMLKEMRDKESEFEMRLDKLDTLTERLNKRIISIDKKKMGRTRKKRLNTALKN